MKIKSAFLGLIGSLTVALPVSAQIQYMEVTPEFNCARPYGILCYDTLENDDKIVYLNITYYDEYYMLAIQQFGPHNMMYIVNGEGEIVSQMMVSDRYTAVPYYYGEPTSDGDIYFFDEFETGFGFLMRSRDW